jgi:hypothetical protein
MPLQPAHWLLSYMMLLAEERSWKCLLVCCDIDSRRLTMPDRVEMVSPKLRVTSTGVTR